MTTRREQLQKALADGDRLEDLVIFYQAKRSWLVDGFPIVRMTIEALPDASVDSGWGGTTDEHLLIAFSERYVYVFNTYDGANEFMAIPRSPDGVTFIPVTGSDG